MIDKSIPRIDELFDGIGRLAQGPAAELQRRVPPISGWSVSQQLDHALKSCSLMLGGLLHPGQTPPRGINLVGRAILLCGRIPRGRAQAPKRTAGVEASAEELVAALEHARGLLAQVRSDGFQPADTPVLPHPFFGGLTPRQTLRNVVVHTRHHLRIAHEILAAR